MPWDRCFNRSMVELKGRPQDELKLDQMRFNRSMVELKDKPEPRLDPGGAGFNRSMVELKVPLRQLHMLYERIGFYRKMLTLTSWRDI